MNEDILLEVKNLTVEFTANKKITQAVKNISFTIKKGESIGIVGESGSGKSVTSLAIMRLIQHPAGKITSGEIWFNSPTLGAVNLLELSTKQMQSDIRGNEIAMIFQEPMTSLNPVYTCGNQVMEAILLHQNVSKAEARKRAIATFDKVHLPLPETFLNCYPHELSGGQKQRVMIAMALACNPVLLIADEPTTALDVTVQAAILEILEELREKDGVSFMFITHDLGVVAEVSDRVMVMYKGNIVEKNDVWDIFNSPQQPYTKGLLACRPRLDFKMKVLPTVSDFMKTDDEGNMIEIKRYVSVGEALMLNLETDDEIQDRKVELTMKKPVLVVEGLSKWFPIKKPFFSRKPQEYIKAVDDVSFNVYPGETLGLVGESGCGKTTLGRLILRLLEPSGGNIFYNGEDILQMKSKDMQKLRKDMQIIFQDPYSSLNPRLTIGNAIMEPMELFRIGRNKQERKDMIINLLEKVSLGSEHFNRYPHEFSGGQRQRICIARALSVNPKFIICDESVSALDVSVQAQVLNLLNDLKEEFHFTNIFISHDLSVIKFLADRMIVMNKGKIEEFGFSEDIYANPSSEYTKNLIKAIPKGELDDIHRNQLRRKEAAAMR